MKVLAQFVLNADVGFERLIQRRAGLLGHLHETIDGFIDSEFFEALVDLNLTFGDGLLHFRWQLIECDFCGGGPTRRRAQHRLVGSIDDTLGLWRTCFVGTRQLAIRSFRLRLDRIPFGSKFALAVPKTLISFGLGFDLLAGRLLNDARCRLLLVAVRAIILKGQINDLAALLFDRSGNRRTQIRDSGDLGRTFRCTVDNIVSHF